MELMTVRECSEYLRTPIPTIRYWRSRGEGPPGFKLGAKRLMFNKADVDAWLEEKRQSTSTKQAV